MAKHWAFVLSVRDWTIATEYVRYYELDENTNGSCGWSRSKKQAVIRILDPIDRQLIGDETMEQSVRATFVHEMVHVVLAMLDDREDRIIDIEQATNAVTLALLGLNDAVQLAVRQGKHRL